MKRDGENRVNRHRWPSAKHQLQSSGRWLRECGIMIIGGNGGGGGAGGGGGGTGGGGGLLLKRQREISENARIPSACRSFSGFNL